MKAGPQSHDLLADRSRPFGADTLARGLLPCVVIALASGAAVLGGDVSWADTAEHTGVSPRVGLASPRLMGQEGGLIEGAWDVLRAAPAPVYFGVLALALVGPVPISLFYVSAGPIYGIGPALAWIAPTLALNALLVHAIGTTAVRPRLTGWIEGRGLRVPRLEDPSDQLLFAAIMRVTPGIPYFLQSWAIVLAGIERRMFVVLSVTVQMVYATGFVVLGRGAFEGRLGLSVAAIAFLLVAGLAARRLHRRLRARAPDLGELAETADGETPVR